MASSSQSYINYDVFLSFRGEDTRKTFVDHLYSALVGQMISTYKGDETLPRGESIRPSLLKAIEGAHIAVIIFSESYADSSWCLDELEHIMKCKDERELTVMPIFYGVTPSEVRKQEGDFGKGFAKQAEARNNINKVESWRKSIVGACEIAGWEPKNVANGHESKAIKEIVDTISDKLFSSTSGVDEDLVGMRGRLQELEAQLEIGSNGVRMVGIWGVGGSGKTTLASSLYMKISRHFQGHCIVENVREESRKHGLLALQETILSRILKTQMKLQSIEEGKRMIRSRLSRSSVLIVLDDVDGCNQLDALAGSHNWFGSGSRIIITTRDEHLLLTHRVDHVYPIGLLSHEEAIQLFNKKAYNEKINLKNYETLSLRVLEYAARLPLALKVLGSFLYDKDEKEWMSFLDRLKIIPNLEIMEILKISYDGLTTLEKELFLDIACFFRHERIDEAMEIFEACGYYPDIGIKVLKEKALITIKFGMFDMHDMVQEMGHYIVRGESPNNPEKHIRLWKEAEIDQICLGDVTKENDKIEVIKYFGKRHLPVFCRTVSNMKKLKWLRVRNESYYNFREDIWDIEYDDDDDDDDDDIWDLVENAEGPKFLSNELRYIDWWYYPRSPFPDSFQPMNLATLKLTRSLQKELWNDYKVLPHLKVLELREMGNLLSTPNFDGFPRLQKFTLENCDELEEIHPSLGNHTSLECVRVQRCYKLRSFPVIANMRNINTLNIKLNGSVLKINSSMERLKKLYLSGINIDHDLLLAIVERCVNLISLRLQGCWSSNNIEVTFDGLKHLNELSFHNHNYEKPELGFFSLRQLPCSLQKLNLDCCNLGDGEIPAVICELSNLQELYLSRNVFTRLDISLLQLTRLKLLHLTYCQQLVELPELPPNLAILQADDCTSLTTIGEVHKECKWLCQVSLTNGCKINDGSKLLESMLQGKTVEYDQCMVLEVGGIEIAKGFIPSLHVHGHGGHKRCRLELPKNWHIDFCGFLICLVIDPTLYFDNFIVMEKVMSGMDFEDDDVVWKQESDDDDGKKEGVYTVVWYVPFVSLRDTAWWDNTTNVVSFSCEKDYLQGCSGLGVKLFARKSGISPIKTLTQQESEFSPNYTPNFEIRHDSQHALEFSLRHKNIYFYDKLSVRIRLFKLTGLKKFFV